MLLVTMNTSGGTSATESSCGKWITFIACLDDVSAHHAFLRDPSVSPDNAHTLRNGSHAPTLFSWEDVEGDLGWKSVLAMTSALMLVAATWYRRHRHKVICLSDGELWVAPGQWVRPLSNLEHLFGVGASVGTMNLTQSLYLQSSQPITYDLVHRALAILTERVLVLQLAMAWRGWWPWYRRTNTITVPLSESNEDPMVVYLRDLNLDYQVSKGPLWRATLVHQPSPCAGTYEAVLVLTIHHAVTDGTTNMILSRDLLSIINGLVTGKEVHTPRRGLAPPLTQGLLSKFDVLPALSFLIFAMREGVLRVLSRGAAHLLPPPDSVPPVTSAVSHDFSLEETAKLARRCKESGVRIHSCLLTACGLAYLRTVRQGKQHLKSVRIIHETAVNVRRYYPSCHEEAVGCVSFHVVMDHHTSDSQDFWAQAKTIQQDLYAGVGMNQLPVQMSRLGYTLSVIFPINRVCAWLGLPSVTYSHMFCSNMGNLHKLLPTDYEGPVRLTRLTRSVAAELMGTCFTVVAQTLGGRFLLSVDHYSTKTTDDTAKLFLSNLLHVLTDIANHDIPTNLLSDQSTFTNQAKNNNHIQSYDHKHTHTVVQTNS